MAKTHDQKNIHFGTYFGVTAMSAASAMGAALMTSWFMLYLTDYAGIGNWGAKLGTVLLFVARLIDAVNDPVQGWIMDNAKVRRIGKYKPFIIVSIILTTVGISCLFFLPTSLSSNPVFICAWVIFFYLMYDFGESFYAPNLIYRTLTEDEVERSKLMIWPRLLSLFIGMACASLIAIVNSVNDQVGNMHTAFGLTVLSAMAGAGVVALVGTIFVKERYTVQTDKSEKIRLTDIFILFRENDALRIKVLADLFSGFIWTFLFATCMYDIKWGFCADLATGAVNGELYSFYALIASLMMVLPIIIGTAIATPLLKAFGSSIRLERFCLLLEAIACGMLFVFQMFGLLQAIPALFFICVAVASTAIGICFIPQEVINMEAMDYDRWKNEKNRFALCNAANKFLAKAQAALSSAMVGVILIAIGYEVDSVTDTYVGDLSAIPAMLDWFILGLISWYILKKYPVTDEIRADMKADR